MIEKIEGEDVSHIWFAKDRKRSKSLFLKTSVPAIFLAIREGR